jgi:hypothetical protein
MTSLSGFFRVPIFVSSAKAFNETAAEKRKANAMRLDMTTLLTANPERHL